MNSVYYFVDSLIPLGTSYFGHGHHHVNHDSMSYDAALADFKECYEVMKSFGMIPVSYAYPGGFGYHIATQNALHDAGFKWKNVWKIGFYKSIYYSRWPKGTQRLVYTSTLIMQSPDFNGCAVVWTIQLNLFHTLMNA